MRSIVILLVIAGVIVLARLLPFSVTHRDLPSPDAIYSDDVPPPPSPAKPSQPQEKTYDLSDTSHWNLTVSAWEALAAKDYTGVFTYTAKCLELYEAQAREMASSMRTFSSSGHEDDYSLVNDVAAAHYIMGEAYMRQKKNDEAAREFTTVIETYPYAQCWDPKGWFWKVAEISKKNLEKMQKEGEGKSTP
jgi:hypothetical protein